MKKLLTTILLALFALSCGGVPKQGTAEYSGAVKSFYVGLAAIEGGDDQRAIKELDNAIELAPSEPASYNNLGVLFLRQRDFEKASEDLEKANGLKSDSATITANLAALASAKGDDKKALESYRKAVELDPRDHLSQYAIAEELEKEGKDQAALGILQDRLKKDLPDNLALDIEILRLTAKTGNVKEVRKLVLALGARLEHPDAGNPEITAQVIRLTEASNSGDASAAARQTAFLKNVLLRLPTYRSDLAAIKASDTAPGTLIRKPLVLPAPDFKPAPADTGIKFENKVVADVKAKTAFVVFKDGEHPVVAYSTEGKTVIGDAEIPVSVSSPKQVAQFDFDYDFRIDLAFATERGLRLFKQKEDGSYEDVTSTTGLSDRITAGSYAGAWAFDYDSEGDLDLVVASSTGPPAILRNDGNGKFSDPLQQPKSTLDRIPLFGVGKTVTDFRFGDFDEDGDADIAFLEPDGTILFLSNERGGYFKPAEQVEGPKATLITSGDVDSNGVVELVAMTGSGLMKMALTGQKPEMKPISSAGEGYPGRDTLLLADLDNNGAEDLFMGGEGGWKISLRDADGSFSSDGPTASDKETQRVFDLADLNADGLLDLIGISDDKPTVLESHSTKNYHWQIIHPKAAKTEGDQRINSYGIGGEMELRSGLLDQKRVINSPQVHFGLGENASADVLRVIWQNGYVQAEFDLKSDQVIKAEQRLKGSCPHLFAWDGEKFEHVKDAPPWSPALGLKINAQDTYGILQTEEWFKIPGEALKPKDGKYELRITGEYWEAYYIDSYKLLAVDHPEGTEVFTDERFSIPLPPLKVFTTGELQPFASAVDHNGRDVLNTVSKLDEKYLDGIKRGKYQGVAEDHWVELTLPEKAPREGKLWIVGQGWMHPTDASINVQRGQAEPAPPRSLSIEIPDGNGGWKAVRDNLGFPAGKMKNVMLDISDVFPAGAKERKLRLRTELEIFWDRLSWAVGKDDSESKTTGIGLSAADIHYRGFSVIDKRDDSSPEIPEYGKILTTGQRWRDLEGYYTRFGDVLELLTKTDDRFVLTNAGDELSLSFPALEKPPKGWKRDFVIIGNGWIKDGDLNSVFSKTLLPLPRHATNDYSRPPTVLEDDPVYQQHKADWIKYHTRYVAPDAFRNALRSR